MPKTIVLGAGMVGSVMAADLAADDDFDVTIADVNERSLRDAERRAGGRLATLHEDLSDPAAIAAAVEPFDLVLGALPSSIAFRGLEAVIGAGRDCCDISFMPEDARDLDGRARDAGVTVVFDCGIAPGVTNMLAGGAAAELPGCERIAIYVGGVPRRPREPFLYKAAFSPADVLEEYTRPARLVEHGRVEIREALSEIEPIAFAGVGTLEAFNTDGLRSLISELDVPFMKEKTVRWPGHARLMRVFRDAGFFSQEPLTIGTVAVRPREVTAALLFPEWAYDEGEEDLTVMRVAAVAADGASLTWEMVAGYDAATRTTSMARVTAFPATSVARLIASGRLADRGVIPPERIGRRPELLEAVLGDLAARGVVIERA